jgi:hypothetical protein
MGGEQMIESRVHLFDIGGDWDPGLHTYGFFFFLLPRYTVTTKLISTLHEEVQNIVMYICIFVFAHYLT